MGLQEFSSPTRERGILAPHGLRRLTPLLARNPAAQSVGPKAAMPAPFHSNDHLKYFAPRKNPSLRRRARRLEQQEVEIRCGGSSPSPPAPLPRSAGARGEEDAHKRAR